MMALVQLRHPAATQPDLILTNLNMPGLSVLDLIGLLKKGLVFRLIPAVILSARTFMNAAYSRPTGTTYRQQAVNWLIRKGCS
ncbi:hypothetical protein [Deinococcus hohokamensis]|uniref:Response regulatory domain-containing protein n=1 Tax=Deinococcus hohokamensis TaxID=309883 RepID=A0ABV9IDF7_9DEIO